MWYIFADILNIHPLTRCASLISFIDSIGKCDFFFFNMCIDMRLCWAWGVREVRWTCSIPIDFWWLAARVHIYDRSFHPNFFFLLAYFISLYTECSSLDPGLRLSCQKWLICLLDLRHGFSRYPLNMCLVFHAMGTRLNFFDTSLISIMLRDRFLD